jgi:Holliday junction resolvase-like predicted endonuclease
MVLKVKQISIRERDELEPMIAENPDVIDQGLEIIARQLRTDSGRLDILGVDSSDGTLVIVELKSEASDGHLDQGLRYYDWCRQSIAWIAQAYGEKFDINPDTPPRLILIAPSFTDTVKRIAKYFNIDLQLFEYHAFESDKGEKGIICTQIDFGQPPDPPEIPTIEEKLKYFQNGKVKELFETVLDELRRRGIEARPLSGLGISCWYKGKRFMWMSPKRHFFAADVLAPGGNWQGRQQIRTRKEWDAFFQSRVTSYLEYLEQGD